MGEGRTHLFGLTLDLVWLDNGASETAPGWDSALSPGPTAGDMGAGQIGCTLSHVEMDVSPVGLRP